MKNDSVINDLVPWQTIQGWQSPLGSTNNLLLPPSLKKNQPTIHSKADSKTKNFYRTKRNSSYTEPSKTCFTQPSKKVHKLKQKINFLNAQLEEVAYATVMKNWVQKTLNTCPIKVTKAYNEIFEEKKSQLKKIKNDDDVWKRIGGNGLQNFTNHEIKSRNFKRDNFKVSFSQFLQLRKQNKNKNTTAKRTLTQPIDIEPAIHVKFSCNSNPANKNLCLRQNQGANLNKSAPNVKARRKLIVSSLKRSMHNNKLFQQLQLNISKCQDLKTMSHLSNFD